MALNPEDSSNGFHHDKVLAFINEQMSQHAQGPQFYLDNLSLSWREVEDKLRAILEDSEVSSEAQVACAWGSLALGVRFAHRQGHLQGRRVQWVHDFARLHKSAALALASDLKQLTEQQEMERKEAIFQLRLARAKLAAVQKERDLLRVKLLQAELRALPVASLATATATTTAGGTGTERRGGSKKEEVAEASSGATIGGGTREERGVEGAALAPTPAEATKEMDGSFQQILGAVEWKNYPLGRQREGEHTAMEGAMYSLSGTSDPGPTVPPEPLTVQLPASFTYTYESPFPATPTPSPPPPRAPILLQRPFCYMASDISQLFDVGAQGLDLQELQKDRRDSESQQERKTSVFRRPGDWDCPWCKAVNFSRRESCFRCGRGIWLQSP